MAWFAKKKRSLRKVRQLTQRRVGFESRFEWTKRFELSRSKVNVRMRSKRQGCKVMKYSYTQWRAKSPICPICLKINSFNSHSVALGIVTVYQTFSSPLSIRILHYFASFTFWSNSNVHFWTWEFESFRSFESCFEPYSSLTSSQLSDLPKDLLLRANQAMNMTLSLEDKKNKIIKEANVSGKEKVWQKVGWIFLLLLIAMLRMAQIKHNPPDFRCWFNESSKICSNATPDMHAVESFRLLANEGASSTSYNSSLDSSFRRRQQ